jgi:hypothetical protein
MAVADGGHSFRLVGPRAAQGNTMLLRVVLEAADRKGMATALVDLQDDPVDRRDRRQDRARVQATEGHCVLHTKPLSRVTRPYARALTEPQVEIFMPEPARALASPA